MKYRQHLTALPTILKLKRRGKSYREIGSLYGMTGAGVRYMVRDKLKGCCPNCLRPLEKEKK